MFLIFLLICLFTLQNVSQAIVNERLQEYTDNNGFTSSDSPFSADYFEAVFPPVNDGQTVTATVLFTTMSCSSQTTESFTGRFLIQNYSFTY